MTNDELKLKLEEIKERWANMPRSLAWKEVQVIRKIPKMEPDPNHPEKWIKIPGVMVDDPRGGILQRRSDVIDQNDPYQFPLIHFHKTPDHPVYNPNTDYMGGRFIDAPNDIDFLIKQLEDKITGGE